MIHAMGFRFRLHRKELPGSPDIVLPRHRKVVLVHGCFWHQHPGCPAAARPGTRKPFWNEKLDQTISRDRRNLAELRNLGWDVAVVWECQTRDPDALSRLLGAFLQ